MRLFASGFDQPTPVAAFGLFSIAPHLRFEACRRQQRVRKTKESDFRCRRDADDLTIANLGQDHTRPRDIMSWIRSNEQATGVEARHLVERSLKSRTGGRITCVSQTVNEQLSRGPSKEGLQLEIGGG